MIAFFTAPVVVGGGLLLLGGAYILNNPQAREVVRDLPKHLPSLLNNLNPFRVDPLANGEARQPERFPKRTPVDGVGGVGGFNDGERVNIPNHTGGGYSPRLDFPTLSPFPGNVPADKPHVETFPGCYEPELGVLVHNANYIPDEPIGSLKRVDGKWLKKKGIDPHTLKDSLPGKMSEFDIFKDKNDNLWAVRKQEQNPNAVPEYLGNLNDLSETDD